MPARSSLLLALLVAVGAWLVGSGTAQAHTGLSSSSPAEGSTVTEALSTVTLDFSGSVRGPEVTVTGPDGSVVSIGAATSEGGTVTAPVTPATTGAHTVAWAVTSADGHDLTGTVTFDYAGPLAVPLAPETPPPTTAPTSAEVVEAQPSEAATETPEDGPNLLITATAAVLVLAAIGGAVMALRRRGR